MTIFYQDFSGKDNNKLIEQEKKKKEWDHNAICNNKDGPRDYHTK